MKEEVLFSLVLPWLFHFVHSLDLIFKSYPMIRILEIMMLSVIIAICMIHAHRFESNKPIGRWFHFWWGFAYAVPAVFFTWRYESVWLLIAFAVERFVFYNPVLNIIRFGWEKDKFFYLHAENSKPGLWDKIEIWWAGFYPFIWALGALALVIVQFYL